MKKVIVAIFSIFSSCANAHDLPLGIFPTSWELYLSGAPKKLVSGDIIGGEKIPNGMCEFDRDGHLIAAHRCAKISSSTSARYIYKNGMPTKVIPYFDDAFRSPMPLPDTVVAYDDNHRPATMNVHSFDLGAVVPEVVPQGWNDNGYLGGSVVTITYSTKFQRQTGYERRAGKVSVVGAAVYEFLESGALSRSCRMSRIGVDANCGDGGALSETESLR